jgi:rubrerythrin
MCDKCFNTEIKYFPTEKDFEEFDLVLTNKISNDKSIKLGKFVNIAEKANGYQIYECIVCGQLWKLSIPDYSIRGYFLRLTK